MGGEQCICEVDQESIHILRQDYAMEPRLVSEDFTACATFILLEMGFDACPPNTVEEACHAFFV